MAVDKSTTSKLLRYSQIFKEARDRSVNESDTVMFLIKMFEDVLGYDSLSGEISKEIAIKDRYCDFCIKIDGEIEYIVEAKSSSHKTLKDKDIEQAENYASRSGINWVLLTNGFDWLLYHLVFAEQDGISHDLVFNFNLVEDTENNIDKIWSFLSLISKEGILSGEHETFLSQKKVLSPSSLIKTLVSEPVLTVMRRELNRNCEFRLDIEDIFNAIRDALSKDALMEAGDLCYKKKRRHKRHQIKSDIKNENIDNSNQIESTNVEQNIQQKPTGDAPVQPPSNLIKEDPAIL
jgi:hypothetical protein